jgi:CHAD domain-containing protein
VPAAAPRARPGGTPRFAIDFARPLPAELTRIVLEQLDLACALLAAPGDDIHDAVHEARRAIRRIRALLQLLRPGLGAASADAVRPFRDAGRALSALRDAQSVIEGVERLATRAPELMPDSVRGALVARLARRRNAVLRREAGLLDAVGERLAAARDGVGSWTVGADYATVWQGLRRGYARAARALARTRRERTEQRLHRWRQRARDHWLQLELLAGVWPSVVGAQAHAAHRLAQRLGAERDLLLVARRLEASRRRGAGRAEDRALAARIQAERERLLARAFASGARVFAERPRAFARRLAAYRDAKLASAASDAP